MEKEIINFNECASQGLLISNRYIYGLSGLCAFLRVSHPTGQKIKNEKLSGCYMQPGTGRKLIFDIELVRKRLGLNIPEE